MSDIRKTLLPVPALLGPMLLALGLALPARAQVPQPAAADAAAETAEPEEVDVAPESPRASLQAYLEAARAGDWEKAARFLSVSEETPEQGPVLAERLKAVLDRHLWFDLEEISPASGGNSDDGLPAGVEEVGRIPVGDGRTEPVRLVRRSGEEGAYWAFSLSTVRRIDGWYDQLDDRWIRDQLTGSKLDALLLPGPYDILWWQWIALPLLVLAAWVLGRLLGRITRSFLGRLFARTRTEWDDRLLVRIAPPLTLAWGLFVFYATLPTLALSIGAQQALGSIVAAGAVVVVFWALWRSVEVVADVLAGMPFAAQSSSAINMLRIGSNLSKGVIAGAGTLAVLSAFGYPVTTLLAGLGIGGLAFAFGAQKTVENLFGSISIAVDQPFRVGDFVKVQDFVGTVEDIGLRSTRFRTLDRTVISIPNGSLADARLESFALRDRMRLSTTIGVEYGTTHDQMNRVLEGFERVLREHPKIWPDAVIVKLSGFGASSLDIEIMAWFEVPTWGDFQLCRQEVLLGFMRVVEEAGTAFAFPTRTVHLVKEPVAEAAASRPAAAGRAPSPHDVASPRELPVSDDHD